MWPAVQMGEQLMARLGENEYDFPFRHECFNTGHNGLLINRGMWRKVFEFLGDNF
jgi:hypothetical protein